MIARGGKLGGAWHTRTRPNVVPRAARLLDARPADLGKEALTKISTANSVTGYGAGGPMAPGQLVACIGRCKNLVRTVGIGVVDGLTCVGIGPEPAAAVGLRITLFAATQQRTGSGSASEAQKTRLLHGPARRRGRRVRRRAKRARK